MYGAVRVRLMDTYDRSDGLLLEDLISLVPHPGPLFLLLLLLLSSASDISEKEGHDPPLCSRVHPPLHRFPHMLFHNARKVRVQQITKVLERILINLTGNIPPRVFVERGTDSRRAEEKVGSISLWDAFPESLNMSAPQPVQPLPSRGCQWCLGLFCPHIQPRNLRRDMIATRTMYDVNAYTPEEKVSRRHRQQIERRIA